MLEPGAAEACILHQTTLIEIILIIPTNSNNFVVHLLKFIALKHHKSCIQLFCSSGDNLRIRRPRVFFAVRIKDKLYKFVLRPSEYFFPASEHFAHIRSFEHGKRIANSQVFYM